MTTNRQSDDTAVDVALFETIGMFRMLRDDTKTWKRAAVSCIILTTAMHTLQMVGLYYTLNDFNRLMYMFMLVVYGMLCNYKLYVLVVNADRVLDVLGTASFRFVTCTGRDPVPLRRCRAVLRTALRTFVLSSYVTVVMWVAAPLIGVADYRVPVVQPDGTVAEYRMTINNLWLPVSVDTFNWRPVWAVAYAIESYIILFNATCWCWFDSFLFTGCFVFNAQFHSLANAYEQLGRRRRDRRDSNDLHESYELEVAGDIRVPREST